MEKSPSSRLAPVDFASSFETEAMPPARARRRSGGRGSSRADHLVARVVERLAATAVFGRLVERDLYTIGELASHLGVSLRTLRFYEQSDLLLPERDGTRRLYTRRDLDRLRMIVALRDMEVPLGEIKDLMTAIEMGDDEAGIFARIAEILAGLAAANAARIDELRRLNARLDAIGVQMRPASAVAGRG